MDPNFGLDSFRPSKKEAVKDKIKNLLAAVKNSETQFVSETQSKKQSRTDNLRNGNYKVYLEKDKELDEAKEVEAEEEDLMLDKFIKLVSNNVKYKKEKDALAFWKKNEENFPRLAILARKYLSVQASSCAVERMFSIAGHIFSVKRRRLGIKFFCEILILKLNKLLFD